MKPAQRVVITGIGVFSPFGPGRTLFWEQLQRGTSAAKWIDTFDPTGLPTRFWAKAPQTDDELNRLVEPRKTSKLLTRCGKMALIAAVEAVAQSGLEFEKLPPHQKGISLGAGGIGLADRHMSFIGFDKSSWMTASTLPTDNEGKYWATLFSHTHPLLPVIAIPNAISAHLSIKYNVQGNCQTITTACTSSAHAIGEAFRRIKFGMAEVMISGGSDSMSNPSSLLSFSLLGVLSQNNDEYLTASRPFDRRRDGFLLSEGSAIFILESYSHCKKRGGEPLAEITGFAATSDAYRVTDEPKDARGSIAAMQGAIDEAELNPEQIDYINAHGTSTVMNDAIETYAIKQVFRDEAYRIPVSSNKSMIGHLVAGAGAIELAASVLSMQYNTILPTINLTEPDPACDLDYVANTARNAKLNTILSNSFGFGGQNACLVLQRV